MPTTAGIPGIAAEERFLFDLQGYLHLRAALAPDEVAEALRWLDALGGFDPATFNGHDRDGRLSHQLNRPISRIIDVDPRFARFLDHPAVSPYLIETLGPAYRHIDNDYLETVPGYGGGGWHRGVPRHPSGWTVDGAFACPMVKAFYCLNDVGPGEGCFAVVPGSHRCALEIELAAGADAPGMHVFDDVRAGDVIVFNEALLHNGLPNRSQRTRRTLILNFGRDDAGVWPGYRPAPATLASVTPRQREILTNATSATWRCPAPPP